MEITEKSLKKILGAQEKKFEKHNSELVGELKRHNSVLYEKFRNDVKIIGEGWRAVRDKVDQLAEHQNDRDDKVEIMTVKLDAVIDVVSESKKDIQVLKKDVGVLKKDVKSLQFNVSKNTGDISVMKSDISIIKNDMKQKTSQEEFRALDRRVIVLENKS